VLEADPTWSCSTNAARLAAHGLIQYPAMMVPSMQRDILSVLFDVAPHSRVVMDPFVGSGTALTETLAAGRSFVGFDINPLAVLIASVKATPHLAEEFATAAKDVLAWMREDRRTDYAVNFPNQAKWFLKSNSIALSRVHRAVLRLASRTNRRFMWVAMAETIRRCSNSRTSTYKLHVRTEEDIARVGREASNVFVEVLERNVKLMRAEKDRLEAAGHLSNGELRQSAKIALASVCEVSANRPAEDVDIVLTSPPYGDNKTTVPYGQFSYLALRWIALDDIDASVNARLLDTTHSLDTASVGGSLKIGKDVVANLSSRSASFARMHRRLAKIDSDASNRWTAYCRDLAVALDNIMRPVRPGGHLVWIIGQRRIRSISAPLGDVLTELHADAGATLINRTQRTIPVKRMPTHNAIGSLMHTEQVCFYQKDVRWSAKAG
jgi:DNA modification methylase